MVVHITRNTVERNPVCSWPVLWKRRSFAPHTSPPSSLEDCSRRQLREDNCWWMKVPCRYNSPFISMTTSTVWVWDLLLPISQTLVLWHITAPHYWLFWSSVFSIAHPPEPTSKAARTRQCQFCRHQDWACIVCVIKFSTGREANSETTAVVVGTKYNYRYNAAI